MSQHRVKDVRWISKDIYTIEVDRDGIVFEPGSCVSINNRTYSIASAPREDVLRFYVRRIPDGCVSDELHKLQTGDTLDITEIHSYFYPGKGCEDGKYCYIATGTGLSPFISALKHYKHRPAITLFGCRKLDDVYIATGIWKESNHLYYTVSQEDATPHKRITEVLDKLPLDSECKYFICGVESMISEVSNFLIKNGIHFSQISTEQFFY